MTTTVRSLALWFGATAVAAFGAASIGGYRPVGGTDRAIALEELTNALNSLNAKELDSAASLVAYREGLIRADAHLRRALRSNPVDTASIERLAMVRWESGVLAGEPDANSVSSLMDVAAARASRVPEIQADLGDLLYKMGRPDEAASFMSKAVSLSPSAARRAVTAMLAVGVAPEEIVRQLPHVPDVFIAIKDDYLNTNHANKFAALVEPELLRSGAKLFPVYGDACLRANEPERLISTAEALGPYPDPEDETERQRQLARGLLASGQASAALSAIARAVQLSPVDAMLRETEGTMLLNAGKPVEAEESFRTALTSIAGTARFQWLRPRLYADIGLALDTQGKAEAAVDSYRIALELDPIEAVASARLRAINTPRQPISRP